MKRIIFLFIVIALALKCDASNEYNGLFGWNKRIIPTKIAVCTAPSSDAERMLVASLSGLATQAVAAKKFNEMIWEEHSPSGFYSELQNDVVNAIQPQSIRHTECWQLLSDYKRAGIVKGYILYSFDKSKGRLYSRRENMNLSANVATIYAGILKGVLIDESLERQVQTLGLKRLKDCRTISMEDCFNEMKAKLNNHSALAVDPKVPNCREYAIANRLMVYYDVNALAEKIMEWVEPLSPIIGWNCPDEFTHTSLVSRWGHFNTASNWCQNMNLLTAASAKMEPKRLKPLNPKLIDYSDTSSFHTYLMSDGDNMQWTYNSFMTSNDFYASPLNKNFGISWTSCPVNLSIMSVPSWNRIVDKGILLNTIVEYGGGYQYPDLFATSRNNRTELLIRFARRLNEHFSQLGLTTMGVICQDVHSKAAREAFTIYAHEIKSLCGIIAIQYYPYELNGEIEWFKNGTGIDIPVVTAKYSIWDTVDVRRPSGGTPSYVASLINRNALNAANNKQPGELSFTIIHAWSSFDKRNSEEDVAVKGINAAWASAQKLNQCVHTISLEELLWRIRMRHRPQQTKNLLQ